VALRIVTTEGLGALTMQRVTDDVGCATGSIYHYFGTKGALVAAVQLEALQILGRSLLESRVHLEELLQEREVGPDMAALMRVVVAARFWVAAEDVFPREIELCRRLFTEPGEVLAVDEAAPVTSPARDLLDVAKMLLDAAVEQRVLPAGSNVDRSIVLLAGTTGVMLTSVLSRWDDQLFEGQRLAHTMLLDLLTAWGADPDQLAEADQVATVLAEQGDLIPTSRVIDLR
jgi:AcrR family transcriptional regulator